MYCEYLIDEIKRQAEKEQMMLLAQEFYFANFGILRSMCGSFRVRDSEEDDFYQLCFLAMLDALEAYHECVNSFLSFYRRCIMHHYYMYKLETRYPMRLSKGQFKRACDEGIETYNVEGMDFMELDTNFTVAENALAADRIWNIVKSNVTPTEYLILSMKFKDDITYREVGERLGYLETQVKSKKNNAFRKLRKNKFLQDIACDFYDIAVNI